MGCGPRGNCNLMYRKPGKDTAHCKVQTGNGAKWDFCAHQYFCHRTNRWELTEQANACPMAAETPVFKEEPKKKAQRKKSRKPEQKEKEPDIADAYKDFEGPDAENPTEEAG